MKRAVNDATLQKVGDIYQHFVALLDCFSLQKGESVSIETYGDISIISCSGNNRQQKEVKHHIGKKKLVERDEDFWNTLHNWYKEKATTISFRQLILFTTAYIPEGSCFENWNLKSPEEKYQILYNIGQTREKREKSFREHYVELFPVEAVDVRQKIIDILGKFSIYSSQMSIESINEMYIPYIGHIPLENQGRYIQALLGWIVSGVKDAPHTWIVSKDAFDKANVDVTSQYARHDTVRLPNCEEDTKPTHQEYISISEKEFVKEIRRIEYAVVIPSAIDDYWKAHSAIIELFQDDILFVRSLPDYKRDLSRRLDAAKRTKLRMYKNCAGSSIVILSQDMYDEVTAWPAEDFGHVVGNQGYFQNGIIHELVDEHTFLWCLED